ncbi:hypothetical protein [Burkholderia ubonensis]|uniref:hypothetical protein n=1 Tax=Burkholderia ubonensis TaxID=101571 RepID=UPI0007521E8C|nr:hypothetical protein [Burkholderia ubonensis]KWB91748.1 hypothetical protein WL43_03370 [Burkholderia ubonensis]
MSREEALLSSLVQCWLAAQPGRDGGARDAAQVERWMDQLRQSAGMLIDHYLEGECREQARQGYDAGIVVGFYGAEAAIAWPVAAGAGARVGATGREASASGLRERMYDQGCKQGRALTAWLAEAR